MKTRVFFFLSLTFFNLQSQCYIPYVEHNRWGLLSDSLHEVLVPQYDYLKNYNSNFWIYKKGLNYGILSKNFQELTPPDFSVIYWIDTQKYVVYEKQNYSIHFWNDTTQLILNVDTVHAVYPNFILVEVNSQKGILNYQNEWKIPPIYQEVITNGTDIIVMEEDKYYFVDMLHKKKLKYGFEEAYCFSEGLALVKWNELYGFVNQEGKWITDCEFLNAQPFQEGLAPVEKNNRWGFINTKNELVIPYIYDFVFPFYKGRAIVQYKGKWGVINQTGKIILPLEYDEIQNFENQIFIVRMKHLWGIMNDQQTWLIPPEFIDFKKFHCSYWIFYTENQVQVIVNEKGKKIWINL